MNWNGITSLFLACMEFILLINLLFIGRRGKERNYSLAFVSLLFIYQLLEYIICGLGVNNSTIAFIAFAGISFLPPLSLVFILDYFLNKQNHIKLIFLPAAALIIYYAFVIPQFKVTNCTIFYASYNYPLGTLFGAVYYLPILITIVLLFLLKSKETIKEKKLFVNILFYGYVITAIPSVTAFILAAFNYYQLLGIIESVMCKFAFILAVCFSFIGLYRKKEKTN